jgi:DNA-binding transcriptional LysR family regulator
LQVKKLEDLLGEPLFDRGPRGVELTRPGRELLGNARRVVALLDQTESGFRKPQLGGPVKIGLPEEYGHNVLGRALNEFAKLHPNVDVTARYSHSFENLTRVKSGELDLAVIFDWLETPGGEVLMIDPTVWTTSDAHQIHERTPLPIALYANSGWCTDFAMKSLEKSGFDYRTVYTSDTNGGLRLAVSSGLAVAPLSRSNIPAGCRELTSADGYGQIDASRIVLHQNPLSSSPAVTGMATAIRDAFRALHQV